MDDKELQMLAAKAAGFNEFEGHAKQLIEDGFDPLKDDGDALRLAVALAALSPGASFALSISKMHDGRGFADAGFFSRDNPTQQYVDPDLRAATRRAIVLAAAEIGKAMP